MRERAVRSQRRLAPRDYPRPLIGQPLADAHLGALLRHPRRIGGHTDAGGDFIPAPSLTKQLAHRLFRRAELSDYLLSVRDQFGDRRGVVTICRGKVVGDRLGPSEITLPGG